MKSGKCEEGHGSEMNLDWHPKEDPTLYRQCVPNKVSDVCILECFH